MTDLKHDVLMKIKSMRWCWRFSILRFTETDALGKDMIGMPWSKE